MTPDPKQRIYLDNNAATRLDDEVLRAMLPWMTEQWGNPSSLQNYEGRAAANALVEARLRIATSLNVSPDALVFTSGATESTALALLGACWGLEEKSIQRVITTRAEHLSVLSAVQEIELRGGGAIYVEHDEHGLFSPASLSAVDLHPGDMVTLQWINNETGALNPVLEVVHYAHERGALVHIDAAQAIGKVQVNLGALQADYTTLSAHKAHGPRGIGALVLGPGVQLRPLWTGGGQESGRRGGTENVASVVGFAEALTAVNRAGVEAIAAVRRLRDEFESSLLETRGCEIICHDVERAPNTTMASWPGLSGREILRRLDELGISASTASACSSTLEGGSHVLAAIGLPPEVIRGAVRFSLSRYTTSEEIVRASASIKKVVGDMRSRRGN